MTRLAAIPLVLVLMTAACGGDEDAPASEGAPAQGGQPGTGGSGGSTAGGAPAAGGAAGQRADPASVAAPFAPSPPASPALPTFGDCAEGWSAKEQPSGVVTCELDAEQPAPPCPPGWVPRAAGDGPAVCEPPALPDWQCPEGWQAIKPTGDGARAHQICAPPALPESCDKGTYPALASAQCQPLGAACPSSGFATAPAGASQVLHVKPGALLGDGSLAKPFGILAEALAVAPSGAALLLAPGTYEAGVDITKSLSLIGACVAEVTLSASGTTPVIKAAAGATLTLSGVTLTGPANALSVASGAVVIATSVHVDKATDTAILVEGGDLTLEKAWITDTQPTAGGGNGYGLRSTGKAKLTLDRVTIERSHRNGLRLEQSTDATARDLVIRDTLPVVADASRGHGLAVYEGSHLDLERGLVERNRTIGIHVSDKGSIADLRSVIVRDTQPQESDTDAGFGLAAFDGATVTASQLLLADNTCNGLVVSAKSTAVTLDDSAIVATKACLLPDRNSAGAVVQDAGSCTLNRAAIHGNAGIGILSLLNAASVTLADVAVTATVPRFSTAGDGEGLRVDRTGSLTGERVLVEGSTNFGVEAVGEGSMFHLTSAIVRDTRRGADGTGWCISARQGASASFDGVVVEGCSHVSVDASDAGTTLTLDRALIQHTGVGIGMLGLGGHGLRVMDGASATVTRSLVRKNQMVSVSALGEGTKLTLENFVISDSLIQEKTGKGGYGIEVNVGADATLRWGLIARSRALGMHAEGEGTDVELDHVTIRDTDISESGTQAASGLGTYRANVRASQLLVDGTRGDGIYLREGTADLRDVVVQGSKHEGMTALFASGIGIDDAVVKGERLEVDHCNDWGIFVSGPKADATLVDVTVQDIASRQSPPPNPVNAAGVQIGRGSKLTMSRALLTRVEQQAIVAFRPGTRAVLSDITVTDGKTHVSTKAFGRAVSVFDAADVTIERCRFENNREAGLVASGESTKATLRECLITGTTPREIDDSYGVGAFVAGKALLNVDHVVARDNTVAGVLLLLGGNAQLSTCWLANNKTGRFFPVDANGKYQDKAIEGVSDGFVSVEGSTFDLDDVLVSGMGRAGLILSESGGKLRRTRVTANQLGMVLRSGATPSYDETCTFEGNATPILPNGDLPVPNAPLPVPTIPE